MIWEGAFGNEYTVRNFNLKPRDDFWKMLNKYPIGNCLEIGCNWGRNLLDIETVTEIECVGVDVNDFSLTEGRARGLNVMHGNGEELSYPDKVFDLVFTVGVLIHQRTPELIRVMKEMTRVSRRYVLFAEYLGDDEEIPYHGERQVLFKRRFSDIYEALFPAAELVDCGKLLKEDGFDNVNYWMYDISGCAGKNAKQKDAWKGPVRDKRYTYAGVSAESFRAVPVNRLHSGWNGAWRGKPAYP